MKKTDTTLFKTAFDTQINALNGSMNNALKLKRNAALESFEQTGLPDKKFETWKYSNIAAWTKNNFKPVRTEVFNSTFENPFPLIEKANFIVVSNGNYNSAASNLIDDGIELSNINELIQNEESNEFVEKYIDSINNQEKDPLQNLNTAFLDNALFLKVKSSYLIENPIIIIHQFNEIPESGIVQNRMIVDVEKGAQVKFVEYFENSGSTAFMYNSLEDVFVNRDSLVEWYRLENKNCPEIHVQSLKVKQEKNSYFKAWSFVHSPNKLRNNTYVQMAGEFSKAEIFGLSLQNAKSHADNHILIDHAVEDCESNQLFKGTYDDHSTAVFNGKVLVRKDAQRTNAFQSNKNLLLSDFATINSKPELEIYADDVKCSHGATTGQISEEQLFYLQARGINKEKARSVLNQAFLAELINNISIPELKSFFNNYLEECFDNTKNA